MSEYLTSPSGYQYLSISNTSCLTTSWLIMAWVANTSSPPPTTHPPEMNCDQMHFNWEVGNWIIGNIGNHEEESGRSAGSRLSLVKQVEVYQKHWVVKTIETQVTLFSGELFTVRRRLKLFSESVRLKDDASGAAARSLLKFGVQTLPLVETVLFQTTSLKFLNKKYPRFKLGIFNTKRTLYTSAPIHSTFLPGPYISWTVRCVLYTWPQQMHQTQLLVSCGSQQNFCWLCIFLNSLPNFTTQPGVHD